MLKKILGESPVDVSLADRILITPGEKKSVSLLFSNDTEYDLPLSASLNFEVSAEVDRSKFDIVVPAEGNTASSLVFSQNADSKIFLGKSIGEMEIADRIFDSKTLYEFDIMCEAAYKCADVNDGFIPSDDGLFSRNGVFYANSAETVFMEIPAREELQYKLHILSGKIKGMEDGDIISLAPGINRLCFEMQMDGSFEFSDVTNDEKIYPDTIGTKYFM